jgi:perosamine synthetase
MRIFQRGFKLKDCLLNKKICPNIKTCFLSEKLKRESAPTIPTIEEIKTKRKQVAKWYQELLAGDDRLIIPSEPTGCDINWFVFVIQLADKRLAAQRDNIMAALKDRGIQVSNYFSPMHLQPFMVEQFGYKPGDFPVTESVSKSTIALPFYNNLIKDQVAIVCKTLKEVLDEQKTV